MSAVAVGVRCPECRDLFVAENGVLPRHHVDPHGDDGAPECIGSGVEPVPTDPHAGQLWANELLRRQRQVPTDREWS